MRGKAYRCLAVACLMLTDWGSSPTRSIMPRRAAALWPGIACCHAQGRQRDENLEALIEEATTLHVGGGVFVQTSPYAGVDARVYPAPVVAYEGERLYVRSAIVGYRLISENGLMIGPQVQPRVEGYSADDSPSLRGMRDRNWSVDGGVNIEAATPVGLLGVSIVTDLLGRNCGQEVEFRYLVMLPVHGFHLIPSGGVKWESENLVNYYYGVKPNEARPGRPAYEGEPVFDPFLRLVIRRKLTKRWSVFSDARYEWLASGITNSPIVSKDYQFTITAGVLYAW
jgi:outer membrane protein